MRGLTGSAARSGGATATARSISVRPPRFRCGIGVAYAGRGQILIFSIGAGVLGLGAYGAVLRPLERTFPGKCRESRSDPNGVQCLALLHVCEVTCRSTRYM